MSKTRFSSNHNLVFAASAFALLAQNSYADCPTGGLIGQKRYTVENQTNGVQYVFVSPIEDTNRKEAWKRIELYPGVMKEVEYSDGNNLVIVNVVGHSTRTDEYSMNCRERYILKTGGTPTRVLVERIP